MSEFPLVIENLSFRYRDRQGAAIHDISFEVKAGEILLIAGASGCGKTTLIRCINGLIPRSYKGDMTGRVLVFGEETTAWKLSQISQKIGTVLQDPERQILGTKVLNEVAFGLENLSVPREEIFQRVQAALDILEIENALALLENMDPRQAKIVELKFYAGLTNEEVASILEISESTVKREWSTAKLFLKSKLKV